MERMNGTEKSIVKIVAKIAPWLAPVPSAYFVARSSMAYLNLPLPMAVVAAIIIETLGLATVHTALWAYEWNLYKRKTDPSAPVALAVSLISAYMIATWGLVVVLEVWPQGATFAPAIFPVLAIVGTVNLVMISRQEWRETTVQEQKAEARQRRQQRKQQDSRKVPEGWREFLAQYPNMLEMTGRQIGKLANVTERTGNNWKREVRNNGQVD